MAKLEYWGASTVQALFRGYQGRKWAHECRIKYMGRWKEMYDDEKGTVFYYNKFDGEVRWRRPHDFLELLPRQICDECDAYEGKWNMNTHISIYCLTNYSLLFHYYSMAPPPRITDSENDTPPLVLYSKP